MYILYAMYDMYDMLLFIWVSRIVLVGIYSIQYIYVVIIQLLYIQAFNYKCKTCKRQHTIDH